jgi:ATP phosphoribosyltransferase
MSEPGYTPDVAVAKNDEMLSGAVEYLEQFGVDTSGFSEEQRGRDYLVGNPEARYFFVNASDAAERYMEGEFDAAVTGSDWAFEHALRRGGTLKDESWTPAYIVDGGAKTSFGEVRRVLASPTGALDPEPTVAAEKPASARFHVQDDYPDAEIVPVKGSSEIFPKLNGVGAYFGIVGSGNTMKQNGMAPVEEYGKSTGVWLGPNPEKLLEPGP